MNEDLKWMAENVHEWPEQCENHYIQKYDDGSHGSTYCQKQEPWMYTRTQWQAARDELSGKSSLAGEPESAIRIPAGMNREQMREFIIGSVGKQWRGPQDGLPPVDTECSILGTESGSWSDGVIDYIDNLHCIWHWSGEKTTMHNHVARMQFRPVRTEEDNIVEEMMHHSPADAGSMAGIACQYMARELYRAGYRKQ